MLLPMDVANSRSDGGLPMAILWLIIYMTIAIMCVIIIPFTIFYYESEDPDEVYLLLPSLLIQFEWWQAGSDCPEILWSHCGGLFDLDYSSLAFRRIRRNPHQQTLCQARRSERCR